MPNIKKNKKSKKHEPMSLTLKLDDGGVCDTDNNNFALCNTNDKSNIYPPIELIGNKTIHPKYGIVFIGTNIIFDEDCNLIGTIIKNKPVFFEDISEIFKKIKAL